MIGYWPRTYYWLAAVLLGIGFVGVFGSALDPQTTPDLPKRIAFASIASLFFFLPGLLLVWATIRVRVIADADGLRWRGMGGWKSATWPQVRDYYDRPLETRVETENGSLTLHDLTHRTLLKQAVQERAKWAAATTWELKGHPKQTLELTQPEIFIINRKQMREYVFLLVTGCVVLPLLILYTSISRWDAPLVLYQNLERTWQTIGPWWALGTLFVGLFPALVYGALLAFGWPLAQFARQRQGESITVSPEGILWRDATTGQQIWSPWKDVTDYHLAILPGWVKSENLHVVKTIHGEIQFAGYNASVRLRLLIQKHCAQHGLQLEWKSKRERGSSPQNRQSFQVYSYRHTELRVMLWLPISLAILFWCVIALRYFGWLPLKESDNEYIHFFIGIPLTLGAAWLIWKYYRFQVITDESGITQCNGRYSTFIAWPDVIEYDIVSGSIIVRSQTQTIRCWSLIGNRKELQKTIQTHAVHSRTQSW